MTPLTHSVNVAGLAVRPAQVGVYPHPLLKISLAAVAVEMLWVPGLVQGTDTILQLCPGCSGYRALCSYLHCTEIRQSKINRSQAQRLNI